MCFIACNEKEQKLILDTKLSKTEDYKKKPHFWWLWACKSIPNWWYNAIKLNGYLVTCNSPDIPNWSYGYKTETESVEHTCASKQCHAYTGCSHHTCKPTYNLCSPWHRSDTPQTLVLRLVTSSQCSTLVLIRSDDMRSHARPCNLLQCRKWVSCTSSIVFECWLFLLWL